MLEVTWNWEIFMERYFNSSRSHTTSIVSTVISLFASASGVELPSIKEGNRIRKLPHDPGTT